MKQFLIKYILFLLAYLPIYVIVALKNINPNIFDGCGAMIPFKDILNLNRVSVLLIILVLFLIMFFLVHQFRSLGTKGNPIFKIKIIENQNKEYITYLGTYILPFIALETKNIFDVLAYVFMFLTIGVIYAKTNLIYTNPVLMLFGYEIFEVTTENDKKYICITKHKFEKGESPIGVKIAEKTYIISKWKNEG